MYEVCGGLVSIFKKSDTGLHLKIATRSRGKPAILSHQEIPIHPDPVLFSAKAEVRLTAIYSQQYD